MILIIRGCECLDIMWGSVGQHFPLRKNKGSVIISDESSTFAAFSCEWPGRHWRCEIYVGYYLTRFLTEALLGLYLCMPPHNTVFLGMECSQVFCVSLAIVTLSDHDNVLKIISAFGDLNRLAVLSVVKLWRFSSLNEECYNNAPVVDYHSGDFKCINVAFAWNWI